MPTLAPIAGCPLVTLAPEPCAPTWPADPVALAPLAVGLRGVTPLTDPPFTASHWVPRPGAMPTRSASAPTGYAVQFKGHTYLSYQGVIGGITGEGPVQVAKVAGAIVRTADGATWEPVFIGDVAPPANYRMPGLLWALDDTLYCVMVEGSRSSLLPLSYVGPGEIAIWTSPNGLTWTKHQVLVTWTAHGTGSFEGGNASELTFRVQSQWRAQGSGPAGAAADWLVVQYEVHARNVFYTVAAPQFRSDDAGQTWTEVRDTLASFPGALGVGAIFAAPRPDVPVDRWVLAGAKRSDDVGATWQTVTGVVPDAAFIVPSGGGVSTQVGGMTGGPTLQVSCDYFQTNRPPAAAPSGNANTVIQTLGFGPAVAGGEELIAITRQGALAGETPGMVVWHTTNGGETWVSRGAVPVVASGLRFMLARVPTGRVLLYSLVGTGGAPELWTCDDEPTDIPTPRTICPFVVEIGEPVGQIAGCASLTFITELCNALPPPPFGPGYETCAAPLGLFVLGENCLGPLELSPTAARRVPRRWSHAHAQ